MFDLFKNWKILVFLFFLLISIYLIFPTGKSGVIIKSVAIDSPLYGKVAVGDSISWMNEQTIKNAEDFYKFENFVGTLRFMKNGELTLAEINSPGLKIIVENVPNTRISLGMDLIGGTRVLLKPKENVSEDVIHQTIATLQTRINIYGLRESKLQKVEDVNGNAYIQIEMAGGSKQEIEDLLAKQGKFEAKIPQIIEFKDGKGYLLNYSAELKDNYIILNGKEMRINETIELDGIKFELYNITGNTSVLMGTTFTGSDIKSVCMQEQAGICVSRIMQGKNTYQFMFQVFVSDEGAERFAKLTKGLKPVVDPATGDSYLDHKIYLFMDNKLISDLRIASELAGKAYTQPMITGTRETKEDALAEKLQLQSILQSGALPVSLETVKIDQVSATLGQNFISSAILSGLIAASMVGLVIFIRYRSIKIAVPIIFTGISEVIMILGMSTIIHWTIDLAAIAGIIATIGTGVDSEIMIIDELLLGSKEEKIYSLKQKIKRAFFIIFGSASTTIAAMIPLILIGIGTMRGFAITTTMGVLIGIIITRPAFGVIAERIVEKGGVKAPVEKKESVPEQPKSQ